MPGATSNLDLSYQDLYRRTFREVRNLRYVLPEDSVVSLAREVLVRIARRDTTEGGVESPSPQVMQRFCRALISDQQDAGATFVAKVRDEGADLETLYLVYLAGAARLLGTWWEEDRISLVDVTVGTGRMYAIMRALAPLFPLPTPQLTKSATFLAVPGETHTLGIRMAADLFRKDDWDIDLQVALSQEDLLEHVYRTRPWIVGLSAAGEHAVESLARLIVAIRIQDPAITIMISGQVVEKAHDVVKLMGAEGMAADFKTAKSEMDRLWLDALQRHESTALPG